MGKTPDIIKAIFDKEEVKKEKNDQKEIEEEFTIAGVWKCAYCGTVLEQVIHPYFPNMPEFCFNQKCNETTPSPRFIFLRWRIEK